MSLLQSINPPHIRPPFARYAHGMTVEAGARLLFCSGQLGIAADERIPADAAGQAQLCFANIHAVLTAAGMTVADIVRLNAYVTAREHLPAYMQARDRFIGTDTPPASTLMIVSGFARPEFLVEVEAIAAARGAA
ncbi:MAG TPA: RidA family protein [Roseiflexaceae bacterium]|nr:RidA family protein [Roseiflexaceae bacterium]HMP42114.1 RidA family protein [Roseiflexaceae bacterium]